MITGEQYSDWDALLENTAGRFTIEITNENEEAYDLTVVRAEFSIGAGASIISDTSDFHLGEVLTSELKLTAEGDVIQAGEKFNVYMCPEGAEGMAFIDTFTVAESSTFKGITEYSCVNLLGGIMGVKFPFPAGTIPASIVGVALSRIGLNLINPYGLVFDGIVLDGSENYAQVLEKIATYYGGFIFASGQRVYVKRYMPQSIADEVNVDTVTAAPRIFGTYTVDGLTVESKEDTYTFGTGRVKVSANVSEQEAANIWQAIEGYTFNPGEVTVSQIDPRWQLGDILSVTIDGNTYSVPVAGLQATYDGGFFGRFQAAGLTATGAGALRQGNVSRGVSNALTAAQEAKQVAEATGQHFWADAQGAHVAQFDRDMWEEEYGKPNHGELEAPTEQRPWYNQLVNSFGTLIRSGLVNLASWTRSAIAFYDGQGNEDSNIVARFGANGSTIGKENSARIEIGSTGAKFVDKDRNNYFIARELRGSDGTAEVTMLLRATGNKIFLPTDFVSVSSVTVNGSAISYTHPFDGDPSVVGAQSEDLTYSDEVIVTGTISGSDAKSYMLGVNNTHPFRENGVLGVSEGYSTLAIGYASHAEGRYTRANYPFSHAEGEWTEAGSEASHAEGVDTVASGYASHAQNMGTIAAGYHQTAIGRYNVEDNTSAVIVGNGGSIRRSNALTIDWQGNAWAAGAVQSVTAGATDTLAGTVKLDSSQGISLDRNGKLQVGGRLGQYPNGGVYYPANIEPTGVGGSTFLMTDGAKGLNAGSREFCILAGANLTVKSTAAGSTVYRARNTQANRVICFAAQNGFAAIDQADAAANGTAHIESIVFANGDPISFYFGQEETDNDIIITLSRSVNPSAATTKLRLYGNATSTDVITIGQGTGSKGGKVLALGQSCFCGGNQNMALGNGSIVTANNSVALGHTHLVNKQFCFAAGQGHDFTDASNGTSAVGIASELGADTAFAVGNGTFNSNGNTARSNAFEVTADGRAKVSGTPTDSDDLVTKGYVDSLAPSGGAGVWIAACDTPAAQEKTVNTGSDFALETGVQIAVKFNANNTYSATEAAPVKLNVNGTGAYPVYYANTGARTGTDTTAFGRANYYNYYVFDGTYWVWRGSSVDNNTTYTNMSAAEAKTGTATTARSISAKTLNDLITERAILTAPNGTKWKLAVDNNGNLMTTAV